MMQLTYILSAVILLGLCVFIHELGHLLGGKMVGIKAKVFSIGYGKGIIKKKIGDTIFQITPIPLGGYCQFYGEDPSETREGKGYEFLSASPMRRIFTVIMGPLFNLFFGIILFFMMNLIGYSTETNQISIPEYLKSGEYISAAFAGGIMDGDKIVEIDGKKIVSFFDIQSSILFSKGKEVNIKVDRNGQLLSYLIKPRKYSEKDHYSIGVVYYGYRTLIMGVTEGDVASKAGIEQYDEIKSINGKDIKSPKEFTEIVRANTGKELKLEIIRAGKETSVNLTPRVREILTIREFEDGRFKGEKFDISIDKMGLVRNSIQNKKLKINDITITTFNQLEQVLRENKDKLIRITNSGGAYYGKASYEKYGYVGVETMTSPDMIEIRYGVIAGFWRALVEPYNFIVMNLKSMGMLFSGELELRQSLGGPIKIMQIAGQTAYYRGIAAFIILMAKISIILMIMNLLPIPIVDGSFILFFLYEALRGKPINEKVLQKIQYVGIGILTLLMVFAIFNDLSSFSFFQKLFN